MSCKWVPLLKPPHPSTVSGLSPLAERIIEALVKKSYEKRELAYQQCAGASCCMSSVLQTAGQQVIIENVDANVIASDPSELADVNDEDRHFMVCDKEYNDNDSLEKDEIAELFSQTSNFLKSQNQVEENYERQMQSMVQASSDSAKVLPSYLLNSQYKAPELFVLCNNDIFYSNNSNVNNQSKQNVKGKIYPSSIASKQDKISKYFQPKKVEQSKKNVYGGDVKKVNKSKVLGQLKISQFFKAAKCANMASPATNKFKKAIKKTEGTCIVDEFGDWDNDTFLNIPEDIEVTVKQVPNTRQMQPKNVEKNGAATILTDRVKNDEHIFKEPLPVIVKHKTVKEMKKAQMKEPAGKRWMNLLEKSKTTKFQDTEMEKDFKSQKKFEEISHKENEIVMDNPTNSEGTKVNFQAKTRNLDEPKLIHNCVENDEAMEETSKKSVKSSKSEPPNKKQKFIAPVKKINESVPIFDLNEASIEDMGDQIFHNPPLEVCITILYKDSCCQLNKPDSSGRSSDGVLLRLVWEISNIEFCYIRTEPKFWPQGHKQLRAFLQALLTCSCPKICCNAQEVWDPIIAHWLIDPDNPSTNLKQLLMSLKQDTSEFLKVRDARSKACKLLDLLSSTMTLLREELEARKLWKLFVDIETPLIPILAYMEYRGIEIDRKKMTDIGELVRKRLKVIENESHTLAGKKFSLTSPLQVGRILFDQLKLDVKGNMAVKGAANMGAKSTSKSVLLSLSDTHPLPCLMLEHRKLQTIQSTFVEGVLSVAKNDVIHPVWEQTSAATGRIVSSNPHVQATPKDLISVKINDDEEGTVDLRGCYTPRKGFSFLLVDFQHMEFRILAHLSQDPTLLRLCQESGDIFMKLGEQWLGDTYGGGIREKTKRMVYSIMYGAGPEKLTEFLNVSKQTASDIVHSFFTTFPEVKNYTRDVIDRCRRDGYLTTLTGRRRYFPNIKNGNFNLKSHAERQAVNFVIQGSAADLCKKAMLLTENKFAENPTLDVYLLLQIHDELIWEVDTAQVEQVKEIVRNVMEDTQSLTGGAAKLIVPVPLTISVKETWGSART